MLNHHCSAESRGEAEPGMRHRAVAPQIAVPGVVLLVDAALGHGAVQDIEPLLALAAADDLADLLRLPREAVKYDQFSGRR